MPTYVVLMNWTDQGIRSVKDTVQRRDQANALAEKHGASIEEVYWTVGPYDLVTIVEAPDDESATAMLLELATAGNLSLRFKQEEFCEEHKAHSKTPSLAVFVGI